jgi:DNA-binding transcriptional LysR family regulator
LIAGIKSMDVASLDLNLLVVFDAMLRHGSVTAAGNELGMSQPATSYALQKMRKAFGDPLFVRVDAGMQPTARALSMAGVVTEVLQRIRVGLLNQNSFNPADSTRLFRIASSDIGESLFTPRLFDALHQKAPNLRLQFVSSTPSAVEGQLAAGEIDLALGHHPDLAGADFFRQALFTSSFVVIASDQNAELLDRKLTMARFLQLSHVDVVTPGRTQEIILRHMNKHKIIRNVPLQVSRFLSLLDIVPQTNLLAVVPKEVALEFRNSRSTVVYELPFESPTFRLHSHWHKRFHEDPGIRWLRELVYMLFKEGH